MRLLHPETLRIIAEENVDFSNATSSRKQVISHAWSEVLKFKATEQTHPKMFIHNDYNLGVYMSVVKIYGDIAGCNFNEELLKKYSNLYIGYTSFNDRGLLEYFDVNYLFSDAVSLYFKGINILPFIFGDKWRKYVPVESLTEIHRQVTKTLGKEVI